MKICERDRNDSLWAYARNYKWIARWRPFVFWEPFAHLKLDDQPHIDSSVGKIVGHCVVAIVEILDP